MDIEQPVEQETTSKEIIEDSESEETMAEKKAAVEAISKRGRLYLTNLVFDINERMIRRSFKKYGEINDINIPVDPTNNRARGFAFLQFASRNSALKMMKEWDQKKWKGRVMGVKLAMDKREYKEKNSKKEAKTGEVEMDENIDIVPAEGADDTLKEGEELAEDDFDALDNLVMQNVMGLGDDFSFEDEDEEDEDDEENTFKEVNLDDEEDDMEDENLDEGETNNLKISESSLKLNPKKEEEKVDPLKQDEDLSATVFIKGIPLEIDEKKFLKFCQAIGEVHYAKLVKMKDRSNRHNGNGFTKFADGQLAKKVIDMTVQLDRGSYIPGENDPNVFLTGSRIKFLPCISKREAHGKKQKRNKELKDKYDNREASVKNLKDKKKKTSNNMDTLIEKDRSDKRRLKYSQLGFNVLDERTFKGLNPTEVNQRKEHHNEKKEKMKNPNLFISKTRILFKNIAKFYDQRMLGRKVKEILGKGFYKFGVDEETSMINKKKIFRQVKIMTEEDKNGATQSKGTAFVEFTDPFHAEIFLKSVDDIKVARSLGEKRMPIVEFAFEDIRKVRQIEKHREEQKNREVQSTAEMNGFGFVNKIMEKHQQKKKKFERKNGQKTLEQKKAENQKSLVNARLREIKANPTNYDMKFLRETYHLAENRGKKQRVKNLFVKMYPGFTPFNDKKNKKKKFDKKPSQATGLEKAIHTIDRSMYHSYEGYQPKKVEAPPKVVEQKAEFNANIKPQVQEHLFDQALKFVDEQDHKYNKFKPRNQPHNQHKSRKERNGLKKRNPNGRNGRNSERSRKYQAYKNPQGQITDKFDQMAKKYVQSKQKKLKWDKQ